MGLEDVQIFAGISKPLTRDAALFDAPASGTPVPADAAVLDTLRSAKSTEEQVLDAAFRLASAKIANAAQAGMLGPGDLAGLARASEELRRAREAQLDLAERQKRLVDRDVAAGAVGILVGRMLTVLNNVGNLLAPRVEEWREDPRHHQLDASARARVVREWFEEQVRTMRVEEADQVEAAMREAEEDAGA